MEKQIRRKSHFSYLMVGLVMILALVTKAIAQADNCERLIGTAVFSDYESEQVRKEMSLDGVRHEHRLIQVQCCKGDYGRVSGLKMTYAKLNRSDKGSQVEPDLVGCIGIEEDLCSQDLTGCYEPVSLVESWESYEPITEIKFSSNEFLFDIHVKLGNQAKFISVCSESQNVRFNQNDLNDQSFPLASPLKSFYYTLSSEGGHITSLSPIVNECSPTNSPRSLNDDDSCRWPADIEVQTQEIFLEKLADVNEVFDMIVMPDEVQLECSSTTLETQQQSSIELLIEGQSAIDYFSSVQSKTLLVSKTIEITQTTKVFKQTIADENLLDEYTLTLANVHLMSNCLFEKNFVYLGQMTAYIGDPLPQSRLIAPPDSTLCPEMQIQLLPSGLPESMLYLDGPIVVLDVSQADDSLSGYFGPYMLLSVPSLGNLYYVEMLVILKETVITCSIDEGMQRTIYSYQEKESAILELAVYEPVCETNATPQFLVFYTLKAFVQDEEVQDVIQRQPSLLDTSFAISIQDELLVGQKIEIRQQTRVYDGRGISQAIDDIAEIEESDLIDQGRFEQEIEVVRAQVTVRNICETLQIKQKELKTMRSVVLSDVLQRQAYSPLEDYSGLIEAGVCSEPSVTLSSELPETVLYLENGEIILDCSNNESGIGLAGNHTGNLIVEISYDRLIVLPFEVVIEPYNPHCELLDQEFYEENPAVKDYYLEDDDQNLHLQNFTLGDVQCSPAQYQYTIESSEIRAFVVNDDGQLVDITDTVITQITSEGQDVYVFQTVDADLADKSVQVKQVTKITPKRTGDIGFEIQKLKASFHINSRCKELEIEQISLPKMHTKSDQGTIVTLNAGKLRDNFNLIDRGFCGRVIVKLELLDGQELPLTADYQSGGDLIINLNGQHISDLVGEHQYQLQLTVDDLQFTNEAKLAVLIESSPKDDQNPSVDRLNVPPIFIGDQVQENGVLAAVKARVSELFRFELPATYDENGDDVKIFVTSESQSLQGCDCYELTSGDPRELQIILPESSAGQIVTLKITLRDTYAESVYFIEIETLEKEIEETTEDTEKEQIDEAVMEYFAQKLLREEDLVNDQPNYEFSFFDDDNCLPIQARVTDQGEVQIKFRRNLFVEPAYKNLNSVIQQTGSVQVQIIDQAGQFSKSSDKDFDWTFEVKQESKGDEPRLIVIQLDFDTPEAISSTGNEQDQVRIQFFNTEKYVRCETVQDLFNQDNDSQQKGMRALQNDGSSQSSSEVADRNSIPDGFLLVLDIPAQKIDYSDSAAVQIQEVIESVEDGAKTILFSSIMFGSIFNLSLQLLWGGVHALQIISHIPLNNINFPAHALQFFKFLSKIVAFDLFAPADHFYLGFTETPPYSTSFEELGYESANFLENLGSIFLLFILLGLRQLLQPLLFLCCSKIGCCKCWRKCQKSLALTWPGISTSWIRFGLECYFEIIISCFIGLRFNSTLPQEYRTWTDKISIAFSIIFAAISIIFLLLTAYLTLIQIRPYVKVMKEKREAENAEALRRVAEDEKHKDQIEYGPHAFFRQESEYASNFNLSFEGQSPIGTSKRDSSAAGQEEAQKTQKPRILGNKNLLKLTRDVSTKSAQIKVEQHSPLGGKKGDVKIPIPLMSKTNFSTSPVRDHKSLRNLVDAKQISQDLPKLQFQKSMNQLIPRTGMLEKVQHSVSLAPSDRQSIASNFRISSQASKTKIDPEKRKTIRSQASFVSSFASSMPRRDQVILKRPSNLTRQKDEKDLKWMPYVVNLFKELKPYQMSAQPFYLIHLLRRIIFVIVAMYLYERPWLQVLLYLIQSICMLTFIFNQQPFSSPQTNFLESFNEVCVLLSGYHIVLISGYSIEYKIRNGIGGSLILIISAMILLNFVLWACTVARSLKLTYKKIKYSRLDRQTKDRQLKRYKTSVANFKEAARARNRLPPRKAKTESNLSSGQRKRSPSPSHLATKPLAIIKEDESSFVTGSSDSFSGRKNDLLSGSPVNQAIESQSIQDVVAADENDDSFFRLRGLVFSGGETERKLMPYSDKKKDDADHITPRRQPLKLLTLEIDDSREDSFINVSRVKFSRERQDENDQDIGELIQEETPKRNAPTLNVQINGFYNQIKNQKAKDKAKSVITAQGISSSGGDFLTDQTSAIANSFGNQLQTKTKVQVMEANHLPVKPIIQSDSSLEEDKQFRGEHQSEIWIPKRHESIEEEYCFSNATDADFQSSTSIQIAQIPETQNAKQDQAQDIFLNHNVRNTIHERSHSMSQSALGAMTTQTPLNLMESECTPNSHVREALSFQRRQNESNLSPSESHINAALRHLISDDVRQHQSGTKLPQNVLFNAQEPVIEVDESRDSEVVQCKESGPQ